MATSKTNKQQGAPATSPKSLALLVALGALAALWALFQWAELWLAGLGGSSFCSVNEVLNCNAVWNSPFAASVHGITGVPVAGWGLVWGAVATAAALLALTDVASGREPRTALPAAYLAATVGVLASVGLAFASLASGVLCPTCLATYGLTGAYGYVAFRMWRGQGMRPLGPGLGLAVSVALVAYLALLTPGLKTPKGGDASGKALVKEAIDKARGEQQRVGAQAAQPLSSPSAQQAPAAQPAVVAQDPLSQFLATLPPEARQGVSDALQIYRSGKRVPKRAPRAVVGNPSAPVLITDFTDVLCGHCAGLHEVLQQLRNALPADAFAIEPRYFPLDSGCNRSLTSPPKYPVRCLAAKAQICMEGNPDSFSFSAALFAAQEDLSEAKVMQLARPYLPESRLRSCIEDPQTAAKLADDIAWAVDLDIEGTPLVLVNGQQAAGFAPFLYAIILAKGQADHPAFQNLPPPNLAAHMH